jgi:AcrR family transcriptional regulator
VENKKNRKEEIQNVAIKLFKERGYNATTMRDLAAEVGIEAASLYNHIRSKEEILRGICFDIASRYIAQMNEIQNKNIAATQKISELIRLHVRLMLTDTAATHIANYEWKHLPEPFLSEFKKMRHDYEHQLGVIITQGIDNQEFNSLNPSVVRYSILSAVRWIGFWYRPDRDILPEDLENDVVHFLLNGLVNHKI